MNKMEWILFWKLSAEHANEALRSGKILKNGSLALDHVSEKEIKDLLFETTYRYYLKFLLEMNELIQKTKLDRDFILYRNIFDDIYHELDEGDEFQNTCFTSFFIDDHKNEYGNFTIKINVKAGTHFLSYDDVIILPPGIFKLIKRDNMEYIIKLISSESLFRI